MNFPSFLPDGRRFLFEIFESEGEASSGVYLGSLDSDEFHEVLPVATNAVCTSSGWLVFSRTGGLQAQRFDVAAGGVRGEPSLVANDVQPVSWPPHGLFTVSDAGRIVYVLGGDAAAESEFVWIDLSSGEITPVGVEGSLWNPKLSPDGRYLAFDWTTRETAGDIWVRDLDRGVNTQLTSDPRNESDPIWTPDGTSVIFFRGTDIYRVSVNGSSMPEVLYTSEKITDPMAVTPDGGTLLFSVEDGDDTMYLWTLDLETLESRRWLDRPLTKNTCSLSPDGRWIAYSDAVQDRLELFLRSYPDGQTVHRVSIDGGSNPVWSRDGDQVFFAAGSSLMAAGVRDRADRSVEIERPRQIGTLPPTIQITKPFDVAPDRTRYLTIRPLSAARESTLRLVENWETGGTNTAGP